eukprot:Opistho-2@4155
MLWTLRHLLQSTNTCAHLPSPRAYKGVTFRVSRSNTAMKLLPLIALQPPSLRFCRARDSVLEECFFVAADIPMLIAINCLMLAKVSRVYGVSASADCNANVVLRLLAAGIGSIALPVFEEEGDKLRVELQGELRVRLDRIQARINQLIVGSKDACVGTDDGTVDGSTGASSSPPDADAASLPSSQDESAGSTAGEGGDGECADTVDDQADVRGKDAPATESSPLQAPGNTPAGSELNDGPTTASRIGSAVVDAVQTVGRTVVEELRQDVMVELVKQLSTFLGLHFARSKMMQVVPLVGVAVGAGSNYWFTVRCTEAAVMTLRHHYLRSEHPEAVLAAHEEGSGWDWQVVDGADVGEDDCVHGNVALSAGVADASTQFFAAGQQVPDVEKKLDLPVG